MNSDYNNNMMQGNCGSLGYGLYTHPQSEALPSDAAGIVALAKRRLNELDKQLRRVDELKAERERLLALIEAVK